MSDSYLGAIRSEEVFHPRDTSVCCKQPEAITAVALGAIFASGGLFLLLASFSVLPQGVNVISQWGIGGKICGGLEIGLGLIGVGYGLMLCCNWKDPVESLAPRTGQKKENPSAPIHTLNREKNPAPIDASFIEQIAAPTQKAQPLLRPPKLVNPHHLIPTKNWNSIYEMGDMGNDEDKDPIFDPLEQIDVTQFDHVAKDWQASLKSKKVDTSTQSRFAKFLCNLSHMTIPRQNEVFTNTVSQSHAYHLLKRGIIYLRECTRHDKDLEVRVVLPGVFN